MLFIVLCFSFSAGAQELKYKNILLRDFRTVWKGEVISFNIGTAAHCPGTLASLKAELPPEVKITVWADTKLSPQLQSMMEMRWPDVPIVYGSLEKNPSPELLAAVEASDLLLVSSGSGIAGSVRKSLESYRALTGKPTAAYAIGFGNSLKAATEKMDFCFIRDEKALEKASRAGALPRTNGFAPDAVFDFDAVDEKGAADFLKANGLKAGGFVCCIPGYRYTAGWEFYGKQQYSEKKDRKNQEMKGPDNEVLRQMICLAVRKYRKKVLICAENIPEVKLGREELFEKLPKDVRRRCAVMDYLWSPQLALGVYRKSACVFGIEMHSQVMAAGNGIPAIVVRHGGFGSKSDMWNTVGLGDWLVDLDSEGDAGKGLAALDGILSRPDAAVARLKECRSRINSSRAAAVKAAFYR